MVERLVEMRALLERIVVMVEAEMPEAQRRMERGDDWQFEKVIGMLRVCADLDQMLVDALVVETGDPDFGVGQRLSDWATVAPKGEP
jgi:hypothetical protein